MKILFSSAFLRIASISVFFLIWEVSSRFLEIDLLPGPSEVMVIADDSANPSFIAAALIAQAEHGSGKEKIYLIFSDSGQFEQIISEIKNQLAVLTHRDSIIKIFNEGFLPIHVKDLEEAISVANFVAPEHLELQVNDESLDYLQ